MKLPSELEWRSLYGASGKEKERYVQVEILIVLFSFVLDGGKYCFSDRNLSFIYRNKMP